MIGPAALRDAPAPVERPATSRRTLELVQIFRGAAAVMVMLYHLGLINRFHSPFLGGAFAFGHSGIDFFFVLSGFIMLYVHWNGARGAGVVGRLRASVRFLVLRAVRIFPIYWCVLAVTVAAVWMFPPRREYVWAPLTTLEPSTLVNAIFLADPDHAIVAVAWTLSYELIFYGFFASYFLVGRAVFAVLVLAWSVALATQWAGITGWPHPFLLRTIVGEFFVGCLVAVLAHRCGRRRMSGWWLLLPLAVIVATARAEFLGVIDAYKWWALPYAFLLLIGAVYDQSTVRRYPRALVLVGEASYAIYLIHYGMIVLFAQTVARSSWRATLSRAPNTTLLVLAAIIVLTGILVHWTIERPLWHGARRRLAS